MLNSRIALMLGTLIFAPLAGATTVDTGDIYDDATPPPTARCVGAQPEAFACADTSKVTLQDTKIYETCVFTGGNKCTTVRVSAPVPTVRPGAVTLQCGIDGPDPNCVPDIR